MLSMDAFMYKCLLALPLFFLLLLSSCSDTEPDMTATPLSWERSAHNPVFRDIIPDVNYQSASDGHVFFDEEGQLNMIYSGDYNGVSSIKLSTGNSWTEWQDGQPLLYQANASGKDIYKETAFYRKASNGKHQIYYIGYEEEASYEAQIFLAEADQLEGPYTQSDEPLVSRGTIAGKNIYCITSPSVVEHQGQLYMAFLGWNDHPGKVTAVWVIGATSQDGGYTWSDFQLVDVPIGMEGQITQHPDGSYVAVRTGPFGDSEAIYYASADHPFGPWDQAIDPILVQQGPPLEKDEIIAPQITIDPEDNVAYLFYTGADYQTGWWMMMAKKEE
jgi:hypothetical protein